MTPIDDAFSLRDKRVLVVGGTRGIGRAISERFGAAGAKVLASYVRNEEKAQALAIDAKAAGTAIDVVRADASLDKGRETLLQAVTEKFAELSALVFVAATGVHKSFEQLNPRYFDFTYALNVKAFLQLVQAFAPTMKAGASIVALSSEGAVHAMPHYTLVGSSKAALESMCRHLAVEMGPKGIRVNVLSPGTVHTDAWNVLPGAEQRLAQAAERTPRRRLISPEEVARTAQFLVSDAASGISGHTLVVDGGARIVGAG